MANQGGRPRKIQEPSTAIHIQLPDRLIDGYDRWVQEIQLTVPGGLGIGRADLMRDALERALREHQAKGAVTVETPSPAAAAAAPAAKRRAPRR